MIGIQVAEMLNGWTTIGHQFEHKYPCCTDTALNFVESGDDLKRPDATRSGCVTLVQLHDLPNDE
jgi:hypothetical protein